MKTFTIIMGAALLVAVSLSDNFASPRGGMGSCSIGMQGTSGNALGLSAEQTAKMQTIRLKMQETLTPVKLKLQARQAELQQIIADPGHSSSAVDGKIDEIVAAQKTLQKTMAQCQTEMMGVLTADQKVLAQAQGSGLYGGRMGNCGMQGGKCGMSQGGGRGSCQMGNGSMGRGGMGRGGAQRGRMGR
jgi:Spy/CpxP family protein refolding chaperone